MISNHYKTFVFDCDGVLLDSNTIKSDAFYLAALPYGKSAAKSLVDFHKANGGISRFVKFEYFFRTILERTDYDVELKVALENYGLIVRQKLCECNETSGMRDFLEVLPKQARKIVVSGGMQSELKDVFAQRGLTKYFDNIYGSPDAKAEIIKREKKAHRLNQPILFLGDSRLDYEVAVAFKMDFIFVVDYTEFSDWKNFFSDKSVTITANLGDLIEEHQWNSK